MKIFLFYYSIIIQKIKEIIIIKIKSIAVLGLSAVCILACSKSLSFADAKNFVDTTYKDKTAKEVKSIKVNIDGTKYSNDIFKALADATIAVTATMLGLQYTQGSCKLSVTVSKDDSSFAMISLTHSNIVKSTDTSLFNEKYKYSVKGNEMTITGSNTDSNVSTDFKYVINDNGQIKCANSTQVFTIDGSEGSATITSTQEATF